jgi:hypothetical protein
MKRYSMTHEALGFDLTPKLLQFGITRHESATELYRDPTGERIGSAVLCFLKLLLHPRRGWFFADQAQIIPSNWPRCQ